MVYLLLWKIWKSNGMIIPNIWKHKKCSKPPTRTNSMDEWTNECMIEWITERTRDWVTHCCLNDWITQWKQELKGTNDCINECSNTWLNEQLTNECKNERLLSETEWLNGCITEWLTDWMKNEWMNEWKNEISPLAPASNGEMCFL